MAGKELKLTARNKKSETDKNVWVVDDEAADVVRRVFQMCIDGYGPAQIGLVFSSLYHNCATMLLVLWFLLLIMVPF